MSFPALRVAQLDSEILDNEFLEIIKSLLDYNVGELSDSLKWQRIYRNFKKIVPFIYYLHQYFKGLSPGQELMGVQYSNFTRVRAFFNLVLNHVLPTAVKSACDESHNIRLQRLVRHLETVFIGVNVLHFLYFLAKGGQSNFIRRLLRIETMHQERPTIGEVNFSMLNRELLGHSIASLIILLTPLFHVISRQITNYLDRRKKLAGESEYKLTEDGLILCEKCKNVVVVPILAICANQTESIFCNYCYYVVKQNENFVNATLLKYGHKKLE